MAIFWVSGGPLGTEFTLNKALVLDVLYRLFFFWKKEE